MAVARKKIYTPEEYLKMEGRSEIRHEFVNGEILNMAGATTQHNEIVGNIYMAIRQRTANKPCHSFQTDVRVQIKKANAYTYPDVMIVCGKVEYEAARQDVITNPIVIFEVLSDSTREYDHTRKFQMYRKLPSLQEYVMVEQNQVSVECFRRIESGLWVFEGYESLKDTLRVKAIEIGIPLATIYENVEM